MLLHLSFILAGLVTLVVTADMLVVGAERFAQRLRMPRAVIGMTIVAFGTSLPELMVAVRATNADMGGLALGNIIGSNIANVFLVLGAVGVILPFSMPRPARYGAPATLVLVTAAFTIILLTDDLSRVIGVAAWLCLFAFVFLQMRDDETEDADESTSARPTGLVQLGLGIAGVALGAELLVRNAGAITELYGLREEFIGLTIVAIGTSLPELATVFASIRRNDPDIAVGNIVGSNIFNLLAVGGAVGLMGGARLSQTAKVIDLPFMVAATLFLVLYVGGGLRFGRLSAFFFVGCFAAYMAFIGPTAAN